jgi:murein DD-endopeptidase MepM/ murein hydrolase activator NlpD
MGNSKSVKWLPLTFVAVALAVLVIAIWQLIVNKPKDELTSEVNSNPIVHADDSGPTTAWTTPGRSDEKLTAPVVPLSIRNDSIGGGYYGAKRGDDSHKGVDFEVTEGQPIFSPIDGFVKRKSHPYPKDLQWNGVLILGDEVINGIGIKIDMKIFYMTPLSNIVGSYVKKGQKIGEAQAISKKYSAAMKNHIHIEAFDKKGKHINVQKIFDKIIIA